MSSTTVNLKNINFMTESKYDSLSEIYDDELYAVKFDELDDKADKNLVNTGYLTNCITEIPQNIKVETETTFVKLKAGSKVYVPNGFEQDGTTKKFDEVTIAEDSSIGFMEGTNTWLIYYDTVNGYINADTVTSSTSGTTEPSSGVWYDSTANKIKYYSGGGQPVEGYSLPVALINTNSLGQTSIERIFNGFGFMGGAIFLLPGVKGLIANGKNPDGTYKTIDYVSSKVVVRFDMSTNRNDLTVSVNPGGYLNYDSNFKITEDGYLITHAGTIWYELPFANYATDSNGKIKLFAPKQVFRALDYNDKSIISSWAMPSNKYIDMTSLTYTAPANGYVYFQASSGTNNGYVVIKVNDGESYFRQVGDRNSAGTHSSSLIMPVKKGELVTCAKENSAGVVYTNRFIYAEGEV